MTTAQQAYRVGFESVMQKRGIDRDSRLWDYLVGGFVPGRAVVGAVRGEPGEKGRTALKGVGGGLLGGIGGTVAGASVAAGLTGLLLSHPDVARKLLGNPRIMEQAFSEANVLAKATKTQVPVLLGGSLTGRLESPIKATKRLLDSRFNKHTINAGLVGGLAGGSVGGAEGGRAAERTGKKQRG